MYKVNPNIVVVFIKDVKGLRELEFVGVYEQFYMADDKFNELKENMTDKDTLFMKSAQLVDVEVI